MYFRAASVLICTQSKNYFFLKLFFLVRANVSLYSLLEGERFLRWFSLNYLTFNLRVYSRVCL